MVYSLRSIAFMILSLVCFSGCGYTTGSSLGSQYKTIGIEPFANSINFVAEGSRVAYIPLLEVKVRQAIMDRYQYSGQLRITPSERADLSLKGELKGFERDELRLSENRDVQEYRIRIIVSLVMTDNTVGEVMWSEPSFAGEATYFTTGPQAKSESAAVEDALVDLSRRIVERTLENW